jgi:hypothetical protein
MVRQDSSEGDVTMVFVIVLAFLLMLAGFFLKYVLAGFDVLKQCLFAGRQSVSKRGKLAQALGRKIE